MVLPRLTVLDERYAIGGVLDPLTSIVNTYQAWDLKTELQVDIHEFFPAFLVRRDGESQRVIPLEADQEDLFRYGREQFQKEGQILSAFEHPNLPRELTCIETHNTVYRIVEHQAGATLASVLEAQDDGLPTKTAYSIMMPVLEALDAAHQRGLIHGAVSPSAIFLAKGHGPVLRGFRTAHIMLALRAGDRSSIVVDGVSAPEQYEPNGRQGPWTDVYGCAASLCHMVVGMPLASAPRRSQRDKVPALLRETTDLPEAVIALLEDALSLDSAQRPRSVRAFHHLLVEAIQARPAPVVKAPDLPVQQDEPSPAPQHVQPVPLPEKQETEKDPSVEAAPTVATPSGQASGHTETQKTAQAERRTETERVRPPVEEPPAAPVKVIAREEPKPMAISSEQIFKPEPVSTSKPDERAMLEATPAPEQEKRQISLEEELAALAAAEIEGLSQKEPAAAVSKEEPDPPSSPPEHRSADVQQRESRQKVQVDRKARPATKAKRRDRPARRKGMPVLAALAVVVLMAFSGAYVVMQDEHSEVSQFAHYKAQGDSLFSLANFVAAKTEYERALEAHPNDPYITTRLNETQQRLAEVSETRYTFFLNQGDSLYVLADSLLAAGQALESLSYFAEANKVYYEALKYRPNDTVVLDKGQLTADGMDLALRANRSASDPTKETDTVSEEARPDPETIREEIYNSYLQQGDALAQRGDYGPAGEKYKMALLQRPGDRRATEKIQEIETLMRQSNRENEFEGHITRGKRLCDAGRCAEAKIEFQRALDLKPGGSEALAGIARADSIMASSQKRDQQYQYHRGQGDALAARGSYDEALASYREALAHKPGDAYVQQQINTTQKAARDKEKALQTPSIEDGVYKVVDEAPQLVGGLEALHKKVRFPEAAHRAGLSGRVYVQFIIDEKGAVQNARVIRGIGGGCDEEALRVIREAHFEPGKVSGKPVKVLHTLFVTFAKSAEEE